MLTEKILLEFKSISKSQSVRKHGKYIAGSAAFDSKHFDYVADKINLILAPIAASGEKIASEITKGEIADSGAKQFEILKGIFIEVYDYKATSVTFVRLYLVGDKNKEWLVLYIDENPSTPWWDKGERG
ncbi:MAG: hypothetical protein ABH874_01920 [Methanobacteriota archaeon]